MKHRDIGHGLMVLLLVVTLTGCGVLNQTSKDPGVPEPKASDIKSYMYTENSQYKIVDYQRIILGENNTIEIYTLVRKDDKTMYMLSSSIHWRKMGSGLIQLLSPDGKPKTYDGDI